MPYTQRSTLYTLRLRDLVTYKLNLLETAFNRMERRVTRSGAVMSGTMKGLFGFQVITGAIGSVTSLAQGVGNLGMEIERTRVAFDVMLGSAARSREMVHDLRQMAKETPFSQDEVIRGGRMLLAYGFQANDVTRQLKMLGDVSSGLNIPLGDLIYLHGTLRAQGRAYALDIRQLANRGIPIYEELAKVLGVNVSEMQKVIRDGKVGFADVEQALINMTSSGGKFNNMMGRIALTISGRIEKLKDTFMIMGQDLGEELLPTLSDILGRLDEIVSIIPMLDFRAVTAQFTEFAMIFSSLGNQSASTMSTFQLLNELIYKITYGFRIMASVTRNAWRILIGLFEGIKNTFKAIESWRESIAFFEGGEFRKGMIAFNRGFKQMFSDTADEFKKQYQLEKKGWEDLESLRSQYIGIPNMRGISTPKGDVISWGDGDQVSVPQFGSLSGWNAAQAQLAAMKNAVAGNKRYGLEDGDGDGSGSGNGLDKISSSVRNIHVNIAKIIENLNFGSYERSETQMVEMVSRALVAAINDVNIAR